MTGRSAHTLAFAAALACSLWGCDTEVDVLAEERDPAFALSGFLDAGADTQFVRIERLRPVQDVPDRTLSGTVESTGPDGAVRVWSDSVLVLEGGAAKRSRRRRSVRRSRPLASGCSASV
jgi:hypothetical protein